MSIHYTEISDYLEDVLDPSRPILAVGPGIVPSAYNNSVCLPMDIAILWFAEKSKSEIVVIDLPKSCNAGCHYNPHGVSHYLQAISKVTGTKVNFITDDVARTDLEEEKFGLIWDHGTINWAMINPFKRRDPNATPKEVERRCITRCTQIVENYKKWLSPGGKALICDPCSGTYGVKDLAAPNGMIETEVMVNHERYPTSLTSEQIFIGRVASDRYYKNGFLLPHYNMDRIVEFTKL
jgi:hypothetical protein